VLNLIGMDTVRQYEISGFRVTIRQDGAGYQWIATHRQRKLSSTGYQNGLGTALAEAKAFIQSNS